MRLRCERLFRKCGEMDQSGAACALSILVHLEDALKHGRGDDKVVIGALKLGTKEGAGLGLVCFRRCVVKISSSDLALYRDQ